jgi:ethanolamine utilization protein EutA
MSTDIDSSTSFLSVGLDIGTTTTHLIISRLTVGAGDDPFGRRHVQDKEVIYRSAIYTTPMIDGQRIDAETIHGIVEQEYAAAGVQAQDIPTGAVIVTGETALKQNADDVVQRLAGESSSFAAAVAGANQESILAGRGSGAAEHSRRHRCCALNIDIGGGTSNLAWFVGGVAVAAGTIRVGGRHLVMDTGQEREAASGAPPSTPLPSREGLGEGATPGQARPSPCPLPDGERGFAIVARHYRATSQTAFQHLGAQVADDVLAAQWIADSVEYCGRAIDADFNAIPPVFIVARPECSPPRPDVVFFSGGVAELMAAMDRGEKIEDDAFGDTGPMLARGLLESEWIRTISVQYPAEPIRATVIGAGQFSLMLSGETMWADPALLPLRNVPILRLPPRLTDLPDVDALARAIQRQQSLHSLPADHVVAIGLPDLRQADWETVVNFARQLAAAAAQINLASPWVFTMRDNFGHLLGRTIAEAAPDSPLLVIDEIDTGEADFLDIGRPVKQFRTLIPIVAKSLIFER